MVARNRKSQLVEKATAVEAKSAEGQVGTELMYLENAVRRSQELQEILNNVTAPIQHAAPAPIDGEGTEDEICPLADRIRFIRRMLNQVNTETESLIERLEL